jgi:hypothetical protein
VDPPIISFNYNIVEHGTLNTDMNREDFEQVAAQILLYLIEFSLTIGETE